MTEIPQELLDKIARGEVDALLEGLSDAETRSKPSFLSAVRKFLKDNQLETTEETAEPIMKITKALPIFADRG